MKPNKHERVLAWTIPDTSGFWEGVHTEEIDDEAMLSSGQVDNWLFGEDDVSDAPYEVWYLSALDEVWVYCVDVLGGGYRGNVAQEYERSRNAAYSLRKTAGEPVARWPCPETPEELRTLCRMFIELYGERHD